MMNSYVKGKKIASLFLIASGNNSVSMLGSSFKIIKNMKNAS